MKKVLLFLLILVGLGACVVCTGIGINNSAISQEETIAETQSSITVQVNIRNEKLTMLIDSIKSYQTYEQGIIETINQVDAAVENGNYEQAQTLITDLVKLYPELKSANHYEQYNTELIACENKIANYQTTYNGLVRDYRAFVRKFPNSFVLGLFGYEVQQYELLDFTEKNNNTPLPGFGN